LKGSGSQGSVRGMVALINQKATHNPPPSRGAGGMLAVYVNNPRVRQVEKEIEKGSKRGETSRRGGLLGGKKRGGSTEFIQKSKQQQKKNG